MIFLNRRSVLTFGKRQPITNWFNRFFFQVSAKENLLVRRRKRVATMNENIKAIQEMVETELADNKYSEYLMRLFKTTDHQDTQGQAGNRQGSADRSDEGATSAYSAGYNKICIPCKVYFWKNYHRWKIDGQPSAVTRRIRVRGGHGSHVRRKVVLPNVCPWIFH